MFRLIGQCIRAFIIGFVTVFAAKMIWYAVRDRNK